MHPAETSIGDKCVVSFLNAQNGAASAPLVLRSIKGTAFFTLAASGASCGDQFEGNARNLRVMLPLADGKAEFKGRQGQFARWELVVVSNDGVTPVRFAAASSAAVPDSSAPSRGAVVDLSTPPSGAQLALRSAYAADQSSPKHFLALCSGQQADVTPGVFCLSASPTPLSIVGAAVPAMPAEAPQHPAADALSSEQLSAFVSDGLLIVRGAVDRAVADNLRRQYNLNIFNALRSRAAVGASGGAMRSTAIADEQGDDDDDDSDAEDDADTKSDEAVDQLAAPASAADVHDNEATRAAKRAVTDSPRLRDALGSLIGNDRFLAPLPPGQDALNWPQQGGPPDAGAHRPFEQWHVDGMHKSMGYPFALLVAVAVSEQSGADNGNLHASRGSHWALTKALRAMRAEGAPQALSNVPGSGARGGGGRGGRGRGRGRGDGSSELGQRLRQLARRDVPPLEPVRLSVGDVAFLHPKTAHRRGFNASPDVRHLLIMRVRGAAQGGGADGSSGGGGLRYALDGPFHPELYPAMRADPATAALVDDLASRWLR